MRRLLSILLWIAKTLLLGVALAALVMWPVSCGRWMGVRAERSTMGPGWGEYREYTAGCWDGRVVIGRFGWLVGVRDKVQSGGEGWRWERRSWADTWHERYWPSRAGPLRWDVGDLKDPSGTFVSRTFAAPLWMLALFAGTWPLASITLTIRRQRMQKRAARVGCCQQCGYDLRATPSPGGQTLARCPECGSRRCCFVVENRMIHATPRH